MKKKPERLGKYEIREEIDRGSMGIVYLGHDPYEDVDVALKVALAEAIDDPEMGARNRKLFFNEAHAAGELDHPNIINVIDAGVNDDDGTCYIVMEYIEQGNTLRQYIKQDQILPIEKVVEILFKCAKALNYAHSKGIVHRDIKPSNILVTQDMDVKIADFSIAHMHKTDETHTQVLGVMGSPRYMSPEQIKEDTIGNQTDLYSLGVLGYEMLTAKQPFTGVNFTALVNRILTEEPTPPIERRADIPQPLSDIIMKCLCKARKQRYQTGNDLALDLASCFKHLETPQEMLSEKERFNQVKGLDFFSDFPKSQVLEIVHCSSWHEYGDKEQIITEGEVDDCFYIIVSGEVGVFKGDTFIRTLKSGDCFGEMGYLTRERRSADIRSKGETTMLKIMATGISKISSACQIRFLQVFLRILIGRLSMTTRLKSHPDNDGADDAVSAAPKSDTAKSGQSAAKGPDLEIY